MTDNCYKFAAIMSDLSNYMNREELFAYMRIYNLFDRREAYNDYYLSKVKLLI